MKKTLVFLLTLLALVACTNDDEYTLEQFLDNSLITTVDTIKIGVAFSGTTATVSGATDAVQVSVSGANVTLNSTTTKFMLLTLSGQTTNGSLLVYSQRKYGMVLQGVSITNDDGPAINNQCGKSLYVTLADGTTNTLSDGMTYADATIDQKGALFSEGQLYVEGTGTLIVNGNAKNGIATDDYFTMESGTVSISVAESGSNGLKANDGVFIRGGVLNIDVKADGARGIKNDARMTVSGGQTTITTSGDCKIETTETGVADTTSCAAIKCDSLFTMSGGTLTLTSTGDGGKGINCAENIEISGGTFVAKTTGSNDEGKPKAVKSDTGIVLSGGSFTASCQKSWACDNGTDSDDAKERVTVIGQPANESYAKHQVIVEF